MNKNKTSNEKQLLNKNNNLIYKIKIKELIL